MLRPSPYWWPKPPVILHYGIAVLSVTVALIIAWWIDLHLRSAPHVSLFLCAVLCSARFGGAKPGLLAIVLSALAFDYYFLAPTYSLALEFDEIPRLLTFGLSAFFVWSI